MKSALLHSLCAIVCGLPPEGHRQFKHPFQQNRRAAVAFCVVPMKPTSWSRALIEKQIDEQLIKILVPSAALRVMLELKMIVLCV